MSDDRNSIDLHGDAIYRVGEIHAAHGTKVLEEQSDGSVTLTIEQLNTGSRVPSYVLRESGGTVTADGDGGDLPNFSGTDAGAVLNSCIDALPGGTADGREAHGHIHCTRGDYQVGTTIELQGGLKLTGESWDHIYNVNPEAHTTYGSRLSADGVTILFTTPNVDSESITSIEIAGLTLVGPGRASAGSRVFDDTGRSNQPDLLFLHHNFIREAETLVRLHVDSSYIYKNHIYLAGQHAVYASGVQSIVESNVVSGWGTDQNGSAIVAGGK